MVSGRDAVSIMRPSGGGDPYAHSAEISDDDIPF